MGLIISNAAAVAIVDLYVSRFDAGAGPGRIDIYDGSPPADVSVAPTGTLLVTLTLGDPAFGAAVDAIGAATSTAAAIVPGVVVADGIATYARLTDSDGVAEGQATVATASADINLDGVSLEIGGTVSIAAMTVTIPES